MFSAKADSVVKKTGQSNMFRMTSRWHGYVCLVTKSTWDLKPHNFSFIYSGCWILSSGSRQQNRFHTNIHFVEKESLLIVQHFIPATFSSAPSCGAELKLLHALPLLSAILNGLQQRKPLPIFGATEQNSTFETTAAILPCHCLAKYSFEFGMAVVKRLD